jgi:hypothetical protein
MCPCSPLGRPTWRDDLPSSSVWPCHDAYMPLRQLPSTALQRGSDQACVALPRKGMPHRIQLQDDRSPRAFRLCLVPMGQGAEPGEHGLCGDAEEQGDAVHGKATQGEQPARLISQRVPVTAGKSYRVSGWVKTAQPTKASSFNIHFVNAAGKEIGPLRAVATIPQNQTTPYSLVSKTFVVPKKAEAKDMRIPESSSLGRVPHVGHHALGVVKRMVAVERGVVVRNYYISAPLAD